MARPFVSNLEDAVAPTGDGGGSTVIVIDASWPMAYELNGEALQDTARLKGGQVLDALGSTGQAAIVVAGDEVEAPLSEVTHDLAAVRRVLGHAFSTLRLHRVEAATRIDNEASRQLLLSVGFTPEGVARGYLKIYGEWRDHLKFAILKNDPIR